MLFSVILLLLCLAVAYFHYLQGIFSATLSAILTIISAVLALGYSEQLAALMVNTKLVDQAQSISLVVLFALIYIILRVIFDSFVPGNVRVPVIADKIGAAFMGLIAGLFATGVVAIAGDALPFGAAPGGYSRFNTHDVDGIVEPIGGRGQGTNVTSKDAMISNDLSPDSPSIKHIAFSQDDLVVGAMNKISNGALAGDVPFDSVHPDYLDELFGQRVGMQVGAKNSLVSLNNANMSVLSVHVDNNPIVQCDSDYPEMQLRVDPLPATLAPADPTQTLLIVRMQISGKDVAADPDNLFRFSSGSVRLVAGNPDPNVGYRDYHPVAVLDPTGYAVAIRADDFLLSSLTSGPQTIDLIFIVDKDHLQISSDNSSLFPGSFLQVKRYAIADLSGFKLAGFPPPPNPDNTPILLPPNVASYLASHAPKSGVAQVVAPPGGSASAPAHPVTPAGPATPAAPGTPTTPASPAGGTLVSRAVVPGLSTTLSADLIDQGQTLVATTAQSEIGFWSIADGHQTGKFAVDSTPTFVAANSDGTLGATGSPTNALVLCNFPQRTVTGKVMLGNTVTGAVYSADSKTVAAANSFGTIFFVDAATHEKQRRISPGLHGGVRLIPSSDRSQFLAVGQGEDMYLCSFTADTAPIKLHGHLASQTTSAPIPTAVFAPNGSMVASGGADGTVRLWNTATGALADTYDLSAGAVACVAFSPDSRFIAVATEQSFQILTATGHKTIVSQVASTLLSAAFSPDGQTVATGDLTGVDLWNAQTGAGIAQFPSPGHVAKLFFTPDGHSLVTFTADGNARIWTCSH